MNLSVLNNSYDILLSLQCNFNKQICDKIFTDYSNHLYEKWLNCDQNILKFISLLDSVNRNKILLWCTRTHF